MEKSKIIFITGNRKGIGLHLTEYYLEKGYKVIGCSREQSDFEHKNYHHFICDVTDEKNVKQVIRQVRTDIGTIDILINNAGVASLNHSLLTTDMMNSMDINTSV